MTRPTHRPTVPGSLLAVTAAVAAVALLIDVAPQWRALAVEVVGLALCALGYAAWRRGRPVAGFALAGAGALVIPVALFVAATAPEMVVHRLELLPGLVGLAVLTAGLVPVRTRRERTLVTLGTALLFLGVVTSGVVRSAPVASLLVAGVASLLAWDLGDQAVSLGRQVGRQATTRRATVAHAGGSVVAGVGVTVASLGVYGLDVRGLPLSAFVVLLVAGFLLILSLRH